jgi:purine-binding chemotaxis protein CheW
MPSRNFDWEVIHRRLDLATEAISGAIQPGPAQTRRILSLRANALAKVPVAPDDVARIEILAFILASESYGIETSHVREVCQIKDLTPLPCTPPFVAGVMNLRGQILAILDLRKFFELPAKGLTELNQVIVLRDGDTTLGLLADAILGVRLVATSSLQAGLPTLTGIREKYLTGVTGQMLAVLDGGRLLGDAGLKVNEKATR